MGTCDQEIAAIFGDTDKVPSEVWQETPQRKVVLTRPFWLGAHEVSVGQFRKFINSTGYQTTAEKLRQSSRRPGPIWDSPVHYVASDNHPVTAVSRTDALAFCAWLSSKEGVEYRLPSEAEWEFACRASESSPWCCPEEELSDFASHTRAWRDGPCEIGIRHPNRWGFFDMHGNVWEWCDDHFSADFYRRPTSSDPVCRNSDKMFGNVWLRAAFA